MDNINENCISLDEAAEYLGVKTATIRDWNWIRKNKNLPVHKVGKQWKFRKSELDIWIKSGQSAMD